VVLRRREVTRRLGFTAEVDPWPGADGSGRVEHEIVDVKVLAVKGRSLARWQAADDV
jgi:hypothetical protein